jgi:hypothetical protein
MFAPKRRSLAFKVVTAALVLVALFPLLPEATSTGVFGSAPLYSRMRTSGKAAAPLNVTVIVLLPAVAGTMFFA